MVLDRLFLDLFVSLFQLLWFSGSGRCSVWDWFLFHVLVSGYVITLGGFRVFFVSSCGLVPFWFFGLVRSSLFWLVRFVVGYHYTSVGCWILVGSFVRVPSAFWFRFVLPFSFVLFGSSVTFVRLDVRWIGTAFTRSVLRWFVWFWFRWFVLFHVVLGSFVRVLRSLFFVSVRSVRLFHPPFGSFVG